MQPDDGAGAGHAEIVRQCVVLGLWIVVAAGCSEGNGELREGPELGSGSGAPACAERSAGLTLPEGFCATIFADDVEGARHLVERADGTVFVLRTTAPEDSGGVLALRDTTGDGRADIRVSFAPFVRGTGIALNDTSLFVDASSSVVRFTIAPGAMEPTIAPDAIVRVLPGGGHDALALALDGHS